MTPTTSIHYLFIRQHRAAFRTPVDDALFAVGQTFLKELDFSLAEIKELLKAGDGGDITAALERKRGAINERIRRLKKARRSLDEFVVDGIETTLPLFRALVREEEIINGDYHIHWLEQYLARGGMQE